MQEINLLKSQLKDTTHLWQTRARIMTMALTFLLILELGGSGILYVLSKSTQSKITAGLADNQQTQNRINEQESQLTPAKAFQAQTQNLGNLLGLHIYWSNFFEELSARTFNKASFQNISADQSGSIHLEGLVKNYSELGKLLLGLSTSSQFEEVKLLSSSPSTGEISGLSFSIDLKVKKALLYK